MSFSEEDKLKIFNKKQGKCMYCHKELSYNNYGIYNSRGSWHIDHSYPRAKGGSDHLNNLVPACVDCNITKSDSYSSKFKSVTKPQRIKRRNDAVKKELTELTTPLGIFAMIGFKTLHDWWLDRKQQNKDDYSEKRENPILISSIPWDAVIIFSVILIVIILIYNKHRIT